MSKRKEGADGGQDDLVEGVDAEVQKESRRRRRRRGRGGAEGGTMRIPTFR
jgi:hypothetical protein